MSTCNLFLDSRLRETSGKMCKGDISVKIPGFAVAILCFETFSSVFAVISAFCIRSTGIEKPSFSSIENRFKNGKHLIFRLIFSPIFRQNYFRVLVLGYRV